MRPPLPAIVFEAAASELAQRSGTKGCAQKDKGHKTDLKNLPRLEHLSEDRAFYRNVAEGAGSVEFFDGLVALVEGRVLAGGVLDAMPDRAALVAGGVTWLVIRWLRSTDGGTPTSTTTSWSM